MFRQLGHVRDYNKKVGHGFSYSHCETKKSCILPWSLKISKTSVWFGQNTKKKKIIRSWIQALKMSFLQSSMAKESGRSIKLCHFCSIWREPYWGGSGIQNTFHWKYNGTPAVKEPPGWPKTYWRDVISQLAQEHLEIPQQKEAALQKHVCSALRHWILTVASKWRCE